MNILITGSTGFIGMNLIKRLKPNHTIHLLIRQETNLIELEEEHVFIFSDNIEQLTIYLLKNKIEGVIHLASLYLAQHKPSQIKDLILSNIYLGASLLEATKMAKTRWFLNVGTIWQNNVSDCVDYCPVNLYAATKQALIDLAKFYTETSNLRFCTLKLCDTYGPRDTRKKIFSLFKEIAQTEEQLEMSPGNQLIDILYIDDVIDGLEQLSEMLHSDRILETEYTLGSEERFSLKMLAEKFETVSGLRLNIKWGGREYREREVMIPWISGCILPGWKAKYSIELGIKKYLNV